MKTTKKTATLPTEGRARIMMAMALNSPGEGVHAALPEQKAAVRELEKRGLVTVAKPGTRCAGFEEIYYTATKLALKLAAERAAA